MSSRVTPPLAVLAVAVLISACGGTAGPTGTPVGTAGTTVQVALTEFSVTPNPASVPAGPVTFQVTNSGAIEHELVILGPTDLAPNQLPSNDGGVTVDEDAVGVVTEQEGIAAGASATLNATLAAGSYVLICNIDTHWQSGMRAAFTVP